MVKVTQLTNLVQGHAGGLERASGRREHKRNPSGPGVGPLVPTPGAGREWAKVLTSLRNVNALPFPRPLSGAGGGPPPHHGSQAPGAPRFFG